MGERVNEWVNEWTNEETNKLESSWFKQLLKKEEHFSLALLVSAPLKT